MVCCEAVDIGLNVWDLVSPKEDIDGVIDFKFQPVPDLVVVGNWRMCT